jgi:hypothetical protein
MNAMGTTNSKAMTITGWIVGGLPALMLVFSAMMKFIQPEGTADGVGRLGIDMKLLVPLGVLELTIAVLYLIPRTAVLGAILCTGYLGGAIFAHVRIGDLFIAQAILGVLLWLGLHLRDARLRSLLPIMS